MSILKGIADSINSVLLLLFNMLPDSPFAGFITFTDSHDILGMVNFFIPFDLFSKIMTPYIAALTGYYIYCFIKGTLSSKNAVLDKIFSFFV